MNIGFVYEPFDARTGSYGAHGHYLARELVRRGHTLVGPGLPDGPGLVSLPNDKWGKLRMLRHANVLYIRIGVMHWLERCTLLRLLKPSCPVVWEINGMAEEILSGPQPEAERVRILRRDVRRRRLMAPFVDAAVCVSDVLAEYARQRYGIRRAVVAPNGGDLKTHLPAGGGTALADLQDRFIVLWAGSADLPWQGVEQIFDAARRCERIAPDVLFVLLLGGRGGPNRDLPHLRNTLLLGRTDRETVGRYVADSDCVAVIYRSCELGGLPEWCRRYSPMSPLKLFEAMSARKPVIATAIGQIQEVVRDGVEGLLIPENADALVDAILRLRGDAALRDRLAAAAQARIESAYTWRHTVDRIEPLLLELAEGRKASVSMPHGAQAG